MPTREAVIVANQRTGLAKSFRAYSDRRLETTARVAHVKKRRYRRPSTFMSLHKRKLHRPFRNHGLAGAHVPQGRTLHGLQLGKQPAT